MPQTLTITTSFINDAFLPSLFRPFTHSETFYVRALYQHQRRLSKLDTSIAVLLG